MENNFNTSVGGNMETNHTLDLSERLYKVMMGCLAIGVIFLGGWGLYSFKALPQNQPHEIQVSGEGKAYAKPDIAIVSFGAHTEAPKSQDAVTANNTIMDAVTNAIKALGVEDKDIQTTLYNLSPVYDYNNTIPAMGAPDRGVSYPYPGPSGNPVVRGYALDQQLQVKIRNFDNINAILDAAAKNGANTIGSLQFTVDDFEKVKAEARERAIAKAKEKATGMFAAAGLRGTKIVNISEGYGYVPAYGSASPMLEKTLDAGAPNIQTGEMEINTTVTLTYRVK